MKFGSKKKKLRYVTNEFNTKVIRDVQTHRLPNIVEHIGGQLQKGKKQYSMIDRFVLLLSHSPGEVLWCRIFDI